MTNESAEAEERLVAEVSKLAPRFAARVTADQEPAKRQAARAAPYLIGFILAQTAAAFTEWYLPVPGVVTGIPALFAFSLAVMVATRCGGSLPGLFCAATSIIAVKLFFFPPLFKMSIDVAASKFYGISVGLIAIAMARPAPFDRHLRRRLRRIKEAIRSTRSSSTALPRFSSPIRNS
jgi:hypothetical protein